MIKTDQKQKLELLQKRFDSSVMSLCTPGKGGRVLLTLYMTNL